MLHYCSALRGSAEMLAGLLLRESHGTLDIDVYEVLHNLTLKNILESGLGLGVREPSQ